MHQIQVEILTNLVHFSPFYKIFKIIVPSIVPIFQQNEAMIKTNTRFKCQISLSKSTKFYWY